VSEEYAPSWSKNFAIEYSTKLSPIPEEKTRKVVAEIVSFVLGRRLIDIGDTSFADEGHEFSMQNWDTEAHLLPVKVKSDLPYLLRGWSPYGINVQALCSKPDFPPIPIERIHRNKNQDFEAVLSKLVPIYLNLRDTLALDHALWRYWTFQEMPLGINLPMLVSGIEILASAWFSSEYSASKGNFTPQKEFLDLLQPDFESIKTKLESASVAEPALERLKNPEVLRALMTRLQNSFEMGPGAKMRRFFEEIGIVPTAEEIEALNSRHRQIHTHEADQEAEKLWLLSEHLRTLFHKIILRMLGYDGEYFNYAKHEVHELNSAPLRLCVKIQS
jgi:hypothetical protein